MELFFLGAWAFIKVVLFIFIVIELSLLVEEFLGSRLELRRGFSGTKSTPLRIFARHALKVLRAEGGLSEHFASGLKILVILLAAGLLPIWSGDIALPQAHSFWIYTALFIFGPTFHLILEWAINRGSGWPMILATAERTIGSTTVHFVLAITLVAMTGLDDFAAIKDAQLQHGWLIFKYPWALFIVFSYAVANLFTSFQTVFSKAKSESPSGWSFDDILPQLRRTTSTLFIVDVFFGGADQAAILGNIFLIFKCVVFNIISNFISQMFFKLREDQAEAFILWKLTPISVLILALSLFLPGGLS